MDQAGHALLAAHLLYSRANSTNGTTTSNPDTKTRPPVYKAIGISLAIASGCFIGVSFVLKKVGLLKANEKYSEVAGEGYGYLKNAFWWTGMTLMIIGEICNFVAYAFVDAILVTPLGALSVVITTILSAIFLKERLSMVGKVGCFLCIIGSVVIVMNAPGESSAATIQEMQHFVIAPGFLSYAGVVIVVSVFLAFWAGPRYGKKSMLVYLSICSLIGGLSVVATQGLGAAIVTQIGGTPQFNQWFLYVLLVFVITTLVTEIIFLNKALNLFNAALVTPTYYVYFTSSTIITSAILFRGFKGTATSIITVVMGFFVICAGVVLLQLSQSAKDVPDTAVFSGDLDQIRTIAEQEQPETEPKADAIRGAAAIVRRISTTRRKMEQDEAKRLHEERLQSLEPITEDGVQYEWDGLRRRRTTVGGRSVRSNTTIPFPAHDAPSSTPTPTPHPPLGMSRFPEDDDSDSEEGRSRASTGPSIFTRAKSVLKPSRQEHLSQRSDVTSPTHPVPLTEINVPAYAHDGSGDYSRNSYGLPLRDHKTEYEGASGQRERHVTIVDEPIPNRSSSGNSTLHPDMGPTPPPHSARRQFSFQKIFHKNPASPEPSDSHRLSQARKLPRKQLNPAKGATEEERLGLVKGDTRTGRQPADHDYDRDYSPPPEDEEDDDWAIDDKMRHTESPERELTPPRRTSADEEADSNAEKAYYESQRRKSDKHPLGKPPPPPPEEDKPKRGGGGGNDGRSFI